MGVFNTENTNLNTFMALESSPGRVLFRKDRATEVDRRNRGTLTALPPCTRNMNAKGQPQ